MSAETSATTQNQSYHELFQQIDNVVQTLNDSKFAISNGYFTNLENIHHAILSISFFAKNHFKQAASWDLDTYASNVHDILNQRVTPFLTYIEVQYSALNKLTTIITRLQILKKNLAKDLVVREKTENTDIDHLRAEISYLKEEMHSRL